MFRKIREAQQNEEGFTLIELLVVVIIIGILAAIAIPAFLNQRERAYQAELTSTVRNVALEVEAAATAENGNYDDVAGTTTTTFAGFVSEALDELQGTTGPVTIGTATATATPNAFCLIGSDTTWVPRTRLTTATVAA